MWEGFTYQPSKNCWRPVATNLQRYCLLQSQSSSARPVKLHRSKWRRSKFANVKSRNVLNPLFWLGVYHERWSLAGTITFLTVAWGRWAMSRQVQRRVVGRLRRDRAGEWHCCARAQARALLLRLGILPRKNCLGCETLYDVIGDPLTPGLAWVSTSPASATILFVALLRERVHWLTNSWGELHRMSSIICWRSEAETSRSYCSKLPMSFILPCSMMGGLTLRCNQSWRRIELCTIQSIASRSCWDSVKRWAGVILWYGASTFCWDGFMILIFCWCFM